MRRSEQWICFDLGGVLARICTHWHQAVALAGETAAEESALQTKMSDCPEFDLYQHGLIESPTYLEGLSRFLGLSGQEAAAKVHAAILIRPYDGTEEVVARLRAAGIPTACLSNTNAPHWQIMAFSDRFPAISQLDLKVASHEIKLHKPDRAIFEKFEELAGAKGDAITYFDDSRANVDAALDCGWRSHWIDPTVETAPQMLKHLQKNSPVV